jgi:phosphate uptake regulator
MMNSSNNHELTMETRKVQLTGGSTYTISLPKRWANEHHIEAGRQLYLHPNGDASLIVRVAPPEENETTTAHVAVDSYTEDNLRRTVQALYTVGLDEFTLTASDEFSTAKRRVSTRAATNLVGLEVLEETERRIVFRNLLNTDGESIRQSVLQLEYVTIWMHRNAVMALTDGDADRAERVIERDDEADRLFGLVNRRFQRALISMQEVEQLGFDRPTLFDYYTTARQLERVADHAEKIATISLRLEDPSAVDDIDELVSLANQSREIVVDAASVLLGSGTVEQAYTAFTARDELLKAIDSIDRTLHDNLASDAYLFGLVLDSVRRTAGYGGNIAEAMIQASIRSDAE